MEHRETFDHNGVTCSIWYEPDAAYGYGKAVYVAPDGQEWSGGLQCSLRHSVPAERLASEIVRIAERTKRAADESCGVTG